MNTEPTRPVPDDRIHGDDYGDAWLRPTLGSGDDASRGGAPNAADQTAAHRSTGTSAPSGGRARPYWLIAGLGATLVLASIAGAVSWSSLTGGIWQTADEQKTYSQPVSALTIRGGANDLEVRGGGAVGTVQVARHLSWGPGSSRPTPTETWSGDTLSIDASCEGFLSWCSIDYVVTVPDATTVSVDSGSGDVTLDGSLGAVTVEIGSGDLDGRRLSSATVEGRTGSGDIDLAFAEAPTSLTLKAGSGDVSVRVPDDHAYATTISTGSGDEEVTTRTDPSSTNRIAIETGSGDVEVTNP